MLSNTFSNHPDRFSQSSIEDSQFSWLETNLDRQISASLELVKELPVHTFEEFRFVDYDNTLSDDEWRFVVCPKLREFRWNNAIPVIWEIYSKGITNWFKEYVQALNPKEHLLKYDHFYDPKKMNHIILTAWVRELQLLKIKASWFWDAQQIIVDTAEEKILAMLKYILSRGYLPGRLSFIDDKIKNFAGQDSRLMNELQIIVNFYRAIPNMNKSVDLENITKSVWIMVDTLLRA